MRLYLELDLLVAFYEVIGDCFPLDFYIGGYWYSSVNHSLQLGFKTVQDLLYSG